MNTFTLLSAKFFTPITPHKLVARKSLTARLEQGLRLHRPLALVSAPAGYGKSALIAEWLIQVEGPVAWLSLEEADDDPGRFFAYFMAALRRMDESFCTEEFAALQGGQVPPADILVTVLVNAMTVWEAPHILALDDFQHIQEKIILNVLSGILAHQPRNVHLVVMTREDPPLPLARMRARDQLTEIRAADLRFSETESTRFLGEGMGLALSAGEIARLTERTEGWVAGLQLAGLSLQGHTDPASFVTALSGSNRFILNYLTEEALKTQPADVQDFLLETSILPQLTGGLCDAVTGRADSAALLERLLAANLFIIPLDDEGQWYRYHHLFAELLQHQLRRERAGQVKELYRRASLWHQSQDMPGAAIEHGLAAGDYPRVIGLLEAHHWRLLNQGYAHAMQGWMQSIPAEWRANAPNVNLGSAWAHLLRGNFGQIPPYLEAAQSALARLPPAATETRLLQADLLALQANLAQVQGNLPGAIAFAQESLALAPPHNMRLIGLASLALGAAYRQAGRFDEATENLQAAVRAGHAAGESVTAMLAVSHIALMSLQTGRLRFLVETAEQAIARLDAAQSAPPIVSAVQVSLGLVYYEWNQVEQARAILLRSIRQAIFSGHTASVIYGKVHLARLQQGMGDLESAAKNLDEAGELLAQGAAGWVRVDWIAGKISLLSAQGHLAEAEAILRASGVSANAPVTQRTDNIHLAWLRWMVSSHQPGALPLAERIVHASQAGGRNGTLIHALILGALAGGGQQWLARAHQLADPEGYQRIFIDEGVDDKIHAIPPSMDALTERELEVLRLLADGLTYAQIAEQLVVSVNTVRYHVKGIYGKLGVDKQVQAVERGRALGLL